MISCDRRTFALGLSASLLGLAWRPAGAASPAERAGLVDALRGGGLVVYFRHGATTRSGIDRVDWPRERQRLLSAEGEAQARAVGEAFRRHALPVGEVLASPFARCRDMAEIAFGRVEERRELIGLLSDEEGREQRIAYSVALLGRPVGGGTNRIVVGHSSNIREAAGIGLPEGGAVVARPDGAGGFALAGTLLPDDWAALAG
jgi:phosphohistidine phosphatase SixA